jgi:hypothetical protein
MPRKPKRTAAQRGRTRANRRPKTDENGNPLPKRAARSGSHDGSSSDSDSSNSDDNYRQQPFFGSLNPDSDRASEAALLGRVMRGGSSGSAGSAGSNHSNGGNASGVAPGGLLGTVAEEPESGASNGLSAALAPDDLDGVLPANYGLGGGGAASSSSQQHTLEAQATESAGAQENANANGSNGVTVPEYAPEGFFDEDQYDLEKEKRAEAYLKSVRQEAHEWDAAQKKREKEAKKRRKEERKEEKRRETEGTGKGKGMGKRNGENVNERENEDEDMGEDHAANGEDKSDENNSGDENNDRLSNDENQKKRAKMAENNSSNAENGANKQSPEAMMVDELSDSFSKISMDHLDIVDAQAAMVRHIYHVLIDYLL